MGSSRRHTVEGIGRLFSFRALGNIAVLITFVVVYFLIRAPYYGQKLVNEEGMFAYLFVQQPVGPDYGLYGRINGREILGPLQHPALLYEPMRWLGAQAERFFDLQTLSEGEQTFIMRLSFSLFQLSLWILLLLLVLCKPRIPKKIQGVEFREEVVRKVSHQADREFLSSLYQPDHDETYALKKTLTKNEKRSVLRILTTAGYLLPVPYLVLLIFILSISPLAVVTSTQLHVDGSVGVWLVGLLSLGFYAAFLSNRRGLWQSNFFICIGSFAVALGKNEWSLALLFALVLFVAGAIVPHLMHPPARRSMQPVYGVARFSFFGIILGNAVSYFFDPLNYRGGFDVMFLFSQSSVAQPHVFARWINFFLALFPYLFTLIILFFASTFILFARLKKTDAIPPILFLLFFYSTVLFVGYLLFPWNASARYFAPALIAFSIVITALSQLLPQRYKRIGVLALSAILFNHALIFFLSPNGNRVNRNGGINPQACVQLLDVADGYLNQQTDFISISFGQEYAEKLARQYGKSLCVYTWIP